MFLSFHFKDIFKRITLFCHYNNAYSKVIYTISQLPRQKVNHKFKQLIYLCIRND